MKYKSFTCVFWIFIPLLVFRYGSFVRRLLPWSWSFWSSASRIIVSLEIKNTWYLVLAFLIIITAHTRTDILARLFYLTPSSWKSHRLVYYFALLSAKSLSINLLSLARSELLSLLGRLEYMICVGQARIEVWSRKIEVIFLGAYLYLNMTCRI